MEVHQHAIVLLMCVCRILIKITYLEARYIHVDVQVQTRLSVARFCYRNEQQRTKTDSSKRHKFARLGV